jgi:hypothetical protein
MRPTLSTNRLRLIYLGRIISDGTRLVPWTEAILQRQREQEQAASKQNGGLTFAAIEGAVMHVLGEDATPTSPHQQQLDGDTISAMDNRNSIDAKRARERDACHTGEQQH